MSEGANLNERIALLRTRAGLTLEEAAQAIGIKYTTYVKYEYGNRPNRKNLKKIIDFYGCDEAWLLTGEGKESLKTDQGSNVVRTVAPKTLYYGKNLEWYAFVEASVWNRFRLCGYMDPVCLALLWISAGCAGETPSGQDWVPPKLTEKEFEELLSVLANMVREHPDAESVFSLSSVLDLIKWAHEQK